MDYENINRKCVSRKLLYVYMDLFYEFRNMDEQSKLLFMLKRLRLFKELLNNESLLTNDKYQLSGRQLTVKENMLNNIKEHQLENAYCEFLDFIDDYGLSHDDKIDKNEVISIMDSVISLEQEIVQKLVDKKDIEPDKTIEYFIINS